MHHNSILHESQALSWLSGLATLQTSITAEYALGPSTLHRVYNRYFRIAVATFLLQTAAQQKQWFLVIRSGREAIHANILDHLFY